MALTLRLLKNVSKFLTRRHYIEKKYCSNLVDESNDIQSEDTYEFKKKIGLTKAEQKNLIKQKPAYKKNMETLKVALIGAPNAGKSTIANRIMGWKFAPVSEKVHTTRHKTMGVLTKDNKQVIFLDTPGIIVPSKMRKHNLELSLLVDPHQALCDADIIMVVVDVSCLWSRMHLEPEVLKMLTFHKDKESILVLNKVDLLKTKQELLNISRVLTRGHLEGEKYQETQRSERLKDADKEKQDFLKELFDNCKDIKERVTGEIEEEAPEQNPESDSEDADDRSSDAMALELPKKLKLRNETHWQLYYRSLENIGRKIRKEHGWPFFKDIFMVSAIDGDGIFELKNYLLASTKLSPWQYEGYVVTDQDPKELAELLVWEKLLDNLPKEIPYQIKVKQVLWVVGEDDLLRAQFELLCTQRRHVQTLLGKNGETIQKISSQVKQELMNAFRREMSLQLIVKGTENTLPKPKPHAPKVVKKQD